MSNHAFVFPGQGSQSVGMLSELANQYSLISELFGKVSERLGYDLWDLAQNGPEETLNQTIHTQVVMLTADVAIYQLLVQQGIAPAQMMAGHSLGEYAALVCSDALTLSDAAELVRIRGQVMQDTVPLGLGAMAAIVGLSDEQVQLICEEASNTLYQVTPANYNAIGQVVIAGHMEAVNKAIQLAEKMDARLAKLIPVSVPCHCPLLKEAAERFESTLLKAQFKIPSIPVINNVDLAVYQSVDQIKARLKEQLYSPVRWVETIQVMKDQGVSLIVECGPGKVLSGLTKRIDKTLQAISVNDPVSFDSAVQLLS